MCSNFPHELAVTFDFLFVKHEIIARWTKPLVSEFDASRNPGAILPTKLSDLSGVNLDEL